MVGYVKVEVVIVELNGNFCFVIIGFVFIVVFWFFSGLGVK